MVRKGNNSNLNCTFTWLLLYGILKLERINPFTTGDCRYVVADIFAHSVRFNRIYPNAGRAKISAGNILVMEGDFKSNWKDECIIAGRAFYRKYSEYDFTITGGNFVSNYMESESALVERSGVWYNSFDRH